MLRRLLLSAMLIGYAGMAGAETNPWETRTLGDDARDERRTVYLIPGLASPGSVWDELAGVLVDEGYRVKILTLAGFAGVPPMDTEEFLPVVRDRLAAELAASDGPGPVLVGHSLGAFLALWLAATEPDSLGGIVAVDGVPYLAALTQPETTPAGQEAQAEQLARFMASLTPQQYAAQNRSALAGMISDPADVERVAATSGRSDPATVGRAVAEMLTTDLRPLMHGVRAPVVLIQAADSGENEDMRDAYARQVADIPNHRHVVADKGRHFVQIDDPAIVRKEVLRLLEALDHE